MLECITLSNQRRGDGKNFDSSIKQGFSFVVICGIQVLPEVVGQKAKISLGAFSGAAAIEVKLKEIGLSVKRDKIPLIVQKVKELAIQRRGGVSLEDLKQIVSRI